MTPDMLRAKNAGAEVIVVWSVSTGMEARMFNIRARLNWDVPFVGHPSMASGELRRPGRKARQLGEGLRHRLQELQLRRGRQIAAAERRSGRPSDQGQGGAQRHAAVVGRRRRRRDRAHRRGGARERLDRQRQGIIKYWNSAARNIPAISATTASRRPQHNGYPTDEIVMSEARSRQERHLRARARLLVSIGTRADSTCSARSSLRAWRRARSTRSSASPTTPCSRPRG